MDINISSQIVVQTAAQWAADNTVYSAKRILVTSDAYYGSTDQRKFKIADGVQTWSNLDYMPIEQVTTSTIGSAINGATSATPNDTDLVMSVESSVAKKNTWTQIKAFLKTYFDTVYQAAGSYLTSVNITQTITNGVTDKAPSEDAVYDALALKLDANNAAVTNVRNRRIYACENQDSSFTGSTLQTVLKNIKINGGDMGANGVLTFDASMYKVGTNGVPTYRAYVSTVGTNTVGTTGTPSSSTLIGNLTYGATSLYGGRFYRKFVNKNSESVNEIAPATFNTIPDFASSTIARTAVNINTANDFWLVITASGNAADEIGISNIQVYIDKP